MKTQIRIIVIDDQDSVRDTLRDNLMADGFAVVTAGNGVEGLKLVESGWHPDVVITDILMPHNDGLEIIMSIKRNSYPVRIIAISGGGGYTKSGELLGMAKKFGADAILHKPIDFDRLALTIRDLVYKEDQVA